MKPQLYHTRILEKKNLTDHVFEVFIERKETFIFEAGQFISIIVPQKGPQGRNLRRAYSIASPPEASEITLCVKRIEEGPGSNYLYEIPVGSSIEWMAPYGSFTYQTSSPTKNVVFVATGTGITPFHSMMLSKKFRNALPPLTQCIFGLRNCNDAFYLETLQTVPSLQLMCALSDRTSAQAPGGTTFYGRLTELLHGWSAEDCHNKDFYLCGNGAMIRDVKVLLSERAVKKESIFEEKYF